MQILPHIHLVGSGAIGLSHRDDCHVYLVDGGAELALVDAGCGEETGRIVENVVQCGLEPRRIRYILVTHAHRDHAGGCAALKEQLAAIGNTRVQVVASSPEAHLLQEGDVKALGLDLLGLDNRPRSVVFPPCRVDVLLADGETLNVGDLCLSAIEVAGHNPGCLCYLTTVEGSRVLFAGDVIYWGGAISLGNWPGSDLQAYRQNLKKLAGLGVDALLPGHLMWTVRNGQEHIDRALQAFGGLWPPTNINAYLG